MDVGKFLVAELKKRNTKNGRYSLRQFAQELGISATTMSRLMLDRQSPSSETLSILRDKLGYQPEKSSAKKKVDRKIRFFRNVTSDQSYREFKFWSMVLTEFSQTDGFINDPEWIARKLSLPKEEVEFIINDLFERGIVSVNKNGRWKVNYEHVTFTATKESILEAYQTSTRMAFDYLKDPTKAVHQQRCAIMALPMDPKLMEEAKVMIDKFAADLSILASSHPEKTKLFLFNMAFFPISN